MRPRGGRWPDQVRRRRSARPSPASAAVTPARARPAAGRTARRLPGAAQGPRSAAPSRGRCARWQRSAAVRRPAPGAREGRRRRRWRCARRRPARAGHRPDQRLPGAAGPAGRCRGPPAAPRTTAVALGAARPRPRPGRRPAPQSTTGGHDRRAGSGLHVPRGSRRGSRTRPVPGSRWPRSALAAVRRRSEPQPRRPRRRPTRAASGRPGRRRPEWPGHRSSSGRTAAPRAGARPGSAGCSRRAASGVATGQRHRYCPCQRPPREAAGQGCPAPEWP